MKYREITEGGMPIDKGLNAAIMRMTHILMPTGYDVAEHAPNTLEELISHYDKTKRILVWSGNSDNTIFGDEEINWAFRAWHDWVHLTQKFTFDQKGENAACQYQIKQLFKEYGVSEETRRWSHALIAEIKEQTDYFAHASNFVDDQRAFDLHYLHTHGHYQNITESVMDNPAFKSWFKDSKIVDADGNPMVVYHGTSKNFSQFSPKKSIGGIMWFTNDLSSIENGEVGAAGKGHIHELYASIQNPAGWDEYDKYLLVELKSRGYDGVVLPKRDGTFDGFVFNPNQLKSIHNKGTFDSSNYLKR